MVRFAAVAALVWAQVRLAEAQILANATTCFGDMVVADGDSNGFLNSYEFYQLVLLRAENSNSTCFVPPADGKLTEGQLNSFQGLACSSCLVNFDGGFFCCTRSLNESRVSIAGAASSEGRTFIQETSLNVVCTTIEGTFLSCNAPEPTLSPSTTPAPISPASPTSAPAELGMAQEVCFADMVASDQDSDGFLDAAEFNQFLLLLGENSTCFVGGSNLTETQAEAFLGLACISCLATFDGGASCCFRGVEEARISISGAAAENRTVLERGSLTVACTTTQINLVDSCGGNASVPTLSPVDLPSSPAPAPTPAQVGVDPTPSPFEGGNVITPVPMSEVGGSPTSSPVAERAPVPPPIEPGATSGAASLSFSNFWLLAVVGAGTLIGCSV
jgi:hypothetical protein